MNVTAAVLHDFKTLVRQHGMSEDTIIMNQNKGTNTDIQEKHRCNYLPKWWMHSILVSQWGCIHNMKVDKSWKVETILPSSQVSVFQASRWQSLRYVLHTVMCSNDILRPQICICAEIGQSPVVCLSDFGEVDKTRGATCGRTLVMFGQARATHRLKVTLLSIHSLYTDSASHN